MLQGDRIESSMSVYITLSTMGAAALGNTISDVIGIGSSYYVERAAILVGLGGPQLSPVQLDMPISRRFANVVSYLYAIPLLRAWKLRHVTGYLRRCHAKLQSGSSIASRKTRVAPSS